MSPIVNDITAVILAGGKNTRLNQEKSLLKIRGTCLIDKQVELLNKLFANILISTGKELIKNRFPHIRSIEDEFKDCGPLGGIQAAMKHCEKEAVFVFACDMPSLQADLIMRQIEIYRNIDAEIVVPRHAEGIEPLHAIYSVKNLPYLESCLQNGSYSVRSFYKNAKIEYYDLERENISCFFNINTHSDLKKII